MQNLERKERKADAASIMQEFKITRRADTKLKMNAPEILEETNSISVAIKSRTRRTAPFSQNKSDLFDFGSTTYANKFSVTVSALQQYAFRFVLESIPHILVVLKDNKCNLFLHMVKVCIVLQNDNHCGLFRYVKRLEVCASLGLHLMLCS